MIMAEAMNAMSAETMKREPSPTIMDTQMLDIVWEHQKMAKEHQLRELQQPAFPDREV